MGNQQLRVMFVLSKRSTGGTAQLAAQWVRGLQKSEVDVRILTLTGAPFMDNESSAISSLHQTIMQVPALGHKGPRNALKTIARLRNATTSFDPDLIHAFFPHAEIFARLATFGLDVPIVGTIVSAQPQKPAARTSRAMYSVLRFLQAATQITVGETVRQNAIRQGREPKDLYVAYPGLDVEGILAQSRQSPRRADLGVKDTDVLLIAVGRLVESKGHANILRALAQLPPDYVLAVVGSGPLDQTLRNLTSELKLNERVRFLGTRDDVPGLLSISNAFVSATQAEGVAGYASLEAAIVGVPIVTTNLQEISEIFGGTRVRLVEPGDVNALSAAIRTAVGSAKDDSTEGVFDLVRRTFDLEATGTNLRNTYLRIMARS